MSKKKALDYFNTFLLCVMIVGGLASAEGVQNTGYYVRDFKWSYAGLDWTWSLSIPKSSYNAYQSVPVSERVRNGPRSYGFLVTTNDVSVREMADALHEAAAEKGYEPYDEVSLILAFVQSLPYTSDKVTTGYDDFPRFPLESLVDGGGDCEDTSILFVSLVLILDYDAIFIVPPSHCAVGVWGRNLSGYYYSYNNRTYYYCETTGDGWRIGDIPSDYKKVSAELYSININEQYALGQSASGTTTALAVSLTILLVGGILVCGLLFFRYDKYRSILFSLGKNEHEASKAFLKKCIRCGMEIPLASEECLYCGAKQEGVKS